MNNCSLAILVDDSGAYLLQQKTNDYVKWPGLWCMFGGRQEDGEDALSAIQRELQEELELTLPKEAFSLIAQVPHEDGDMDVFFAKVPTSARLVLHEGKGMGYFTPEEIEHLGMQPHNKKILLDYLQSHLLERAAER